MGRKRWTPVSLPVLECSGIVIRQPNGGPRIELGITDEGEAVISVKDARGHVCLQALVDAAGTVAGFEALTPDQSCRANLTAGQHPHKGAYAAASVTSRRGKDRAVLETSNRYGPECDVVNEFEYREPDV